MGCLPSLLSRAKACCAESTCSRRVANASQWDLMNTTVVVVLQRGASRSLVLNSFGWLVSGCMQLCRPVYLLNPSSCHPLSGQLQLPSLFGGGSRMKIAPGKMRANDDRTEMAMPSRKAALLPHDRIGASITSQRPVVASHSPSHHPPASRHIQKDALVPTRTRRPHQHLHLRTDTRRATNGARRFH